MGGESADAVSTLHQSTAGSDGRWSVRPSTPKDGPAIVALMKAEGLQPHVDPKHLDWKYWQARADWAGSRSFVLTDGRDLLAHIAAVPGTLNWGTNHARVIHGIDWVARRNAAGAGVALMRHIAQMTDFLLGIGGSLQTLKIMPRIGYQLCGSVTGYVRTLSPLEILRRSYSSGWKLAPRIARSAFWSLSASSGDVTGWQSRQIASHEVERIAAILPCGTSDTATMGRSTALLQHALACPIVPVELYAIEKAGRPEGYFLMSYAPGQARLADLWINSEDPADWQALIYLAVAQARRKRGLAELAVWSSDPRLALALKQCGFHERLNLPLYLRGSANMALSQVTVSVQMLDNDAFYLYFGRNTLWA